MTTETALATITPANLDIEIASARAYAAQAKAPLTQKAYRWAWSRFTAFCAARGLVPLPAPARLVASYIAWMADSGQAPATIDQALAAITEAHLAAGLESPRATPEVRWVRQGLRRRLGVAQRSVRPLGVEELKRALELIPDDLRGLRNRALLLLAFATAARRSEVAVLEVNDLEFTGEGMIVTIRKSKTDQEGAGRRIGVPAGTSDRTCPVRSVQRWIIESGIVEGRIFLEVRNGKLGKRAIEPRSIANLVKQAVQSIGLDPRLYSGHSLRSGFATSATRAGKSESVVMSQTGHRNLTVFRKYVRMATLFEHNAAKGIGL